MAEQHPDFESEKKHLDTTIAQMHQILTDLNSDIDDRSLRMKKSVSIKDQISAYVHRMLRNDNIGKIQDIEDALPNPYFGRVDFREDGTEEFNSFYIGRCKVTKLQIEDAKDILVFDWRDPVSTIFYESHGGRAQYEVLGRYQYSGDVSLKRQYKIENGILKTIVDNFVLNKILENQQTALLADPLLIDRLQQGATDKLKDIVTTIQSEQNKIIREPLNQITIVQGVAGSGKTTVGLHRLSYLLYNEKLNPQKLAIVAPNRIFLNYISDLLPDIDAADVKQVVWDDLVTMIIRTEYKLTEDHRLDLILSGKDKEQGLPLENTAQLKGSLAFIQILETYIERKARSFCLKLEDINLFDGGLLISAKEQIDKFVEDAVKPYNERLRTLIHHITFRINNYIEITESRTTSSSTAREQLKHFRKEADAFISNYFKRWHPLSLMDAYRQVFSDKPAFKPVKDTKSDLDAIRSHSLRILNSGQVEREDLAPLAYLTLLIDGWSHITKFDHIMVDEAQDLNALEFAILKRLSSNGSFTIMGDLSQGIHSYRSISSWNVLLKEVFADARVAYREILYSYRSAKEIIDVFNLVMPQGSPKAIPVYETGRKSAIEKLHSPEQGVTRALETLKTFLDRGANSVGIITKLEKDAVLLHSRLLQEAKATELDCAIHLVSGQAAGYRGGVSVIPVSLAKGLEFDGVIIWNASDTEFTTDPLDARLLYVALSRAMHSLHIMYQGNPTPLLLESATLQPVSSGI
jgi:DNA helicase-2/ATP-dependent DNA helicase PcrA